MLHIVYCEDGADSVAMRAQHREAHFAYLHAQEKILILAGAMVGTDGETRIGSCFLINVPDRAGAEAFSKNEPFTKAGLFKDIRIQRMRRGHWNPDAAPQTPEGL